MPYNHWFVSRQKRKLTSILPALIAYSDVCVGKKWTGEVQLDLEDALSDRSITEHGTLRARRAGQGGGGTRTLFKQLKDLGLVFLEDPSRKCRLTLIGEELVKGNVSFVDAMRLQLKRYQYPSAAVWSGSGSVDHSFKVHPFQFIFRLLREPRLENILYNEEMAGIVIHYAKSDADDVFERIVQQIILYRQNVKTDYVEDTSTHTYDNIANTFFNYLGLTQYTDRGIKSISIRMGKEQAVDDFIETTPSVIKNPQLTENYQRNFGRGFVAKDLRNFDNANPFSQKDLNEARIRKEYVLLALQTPIEKITADIVDAITHKTGIDERTVEQFLVKHYPHGNVSDFFLSYKELAHMGRSGATDFEKATCEMFRKVFKMEAKHIGPIGNTPDVFVESSEYNFCGILDNKAYKNGYSITGDHKRVMEDVYIPNYKTYGQTDKPLAFFSYIAESFGANIDSQLATIITDTGIHGSAMPVDLLIDLAQDYVESGRDHQYLKRIFSVDREVRVADIQ